MCSDETDNETQYETKAGNEESLHRQPGMVPVPDKLVSML
jgi:hypothetical protein